MDFADLISHYPKGCENSKYKLQNRYNDVAIFLCVIANNKIIHTLCHWLRLIFDFRRKPNEVVLQSQSKFNATICRDSFRMTNAVVNDKVMFLVRFPSFRGVAFWETEWREMVVIRMGDASDPQNPNFALSGYDAALWDKINAVVR